MPEEDQAVAETSRLAFLDVGLLIYSAIPSEAKA